MFFILACVMGEKGVSSLSLSKAKTKHRVIFKPHDKKRQYTEQCLFFYPSGQLIWR